MAPDTRSGSHVYIAGNGARPQRENRFIRASRREPVVPLVFHSRSGTTLEQLWNKPRSPNSAVFLTCI